MLLLIGGCLLNLKLWNVFGLEFLCRMLGSGVDLASEVGFEQGKSSYAWILSFVLAFCFTSSSIRRSV